jgi:hypothetical protein
MLDTCASIFMPGSPVERATGYTFLSVEPLIEKGVKSFDLWVHNLKSKSSVFVECKSSLAVPRAEIRSVYDAIRAVRENKEYLGGIAGEQIDHVEFVLCVNNTQDLRTAEALARLEKSKEIPEDESKLFLWRMNQFEGQSIQFFHLIPGRSDTLENRHRDGNLMRALRQPAEASGAQLGARAFPSSHSTRKSVEVTSAVLKESLRTRRDPEEVPLSEVRAFFSSRANLGHYDAPSLEPGITKVFLRDGLQARVLAEDEPSAEVVRLLSKGQRPQTRLAHFEQSLDDWFTLRLARQRTLDALATRLETSKSTLDRYQ